MGIGFSAISFPPSLWAYWLIFIGAVFALRGGFPEFFIKHTAERPIAGIKATDEESLGRWAIVLALASLLGIGGWEIHNQIPQRLSLKCRIEGIPVVNVPDSSGVVLIDPAFQLGSINAWLIGSAHGLPPDYAPDHFGKLIYRCELTNLENLTIPDVSLGATVLSIESHGSVTEGGFSCDGTSIKGTKRIVVPIGDLPAFKMYTFFHYNGTAQCSQIQWGKAISSQFKLALRMDEETEHLVGLGPTALR